MTSDNVRRLLPGWTLLLFSVALAHTFPVCSAEEPPLKVTWHTSYREAMDEAERCNKMLFIYFCDPEGTTACRQFKEEVLSQPQVCRKLQDYVCVELPLNAEIMVQGKPTVVLEHEAFREMLGRPGIAIVDFRSPNAPLRGAVVSTFPITEKLRYSVEQTLVILNLPPGTLTQRTLIFAVRIHPDRPAGADGEPLPELMDEAAQHAQYQAEIRLQGHHFWAVRFRRILARLPGGLSPREVCAESWPGENLVEAAIECVRCWRLSEGHWSAVRARSRFFGFDMRRGSNGVWYATGILAAE